jgi:microsomal dipeptidase-like Zn-dependent dipeptidase
MKIIISSLISLCLLVGAFLWIAPPYVEQSMNIVKPHSPWPVSPAAQTLHETLVIGDWHSDSLLWDRDLLEEEDYGHVDFPRLVKGNVAVQVFTSVTKSPKGQNYESNSNEAGDNITSLVMAQAWPMRTWGSLFERALYQVERLHDLELRAPGQIRIVKSEKDLDEIFILRNKGIKITGALMGMEGAHPLEGKLENLDKLYDAGYRLIGLQHFFDNELGGSLHGKTGAGLTEFGKHVVKRAAAKHMIIDVAHSSHQVVKDVLGLVNKPIVLSHTGIHSHCETKRNIPNDLMQAIAKNGGVVGIGYWSDVTCDDTPAGIVKTVRAAIQLIGADHVSLGSDYDGSVTTQFDTSELAALTHEMLAQGFTHSEIKKVMGENMLRVLRANLQ